MSACRACRGKKLKDFLDLGRTPLANSFLKPSQLKKHEASFPLKAALCSGCGLVQLRYVVPPDLMFRDYVYVSSTSPSFVAHFSSFARAAWDKAGLKDGDLAVDVGSNDGVLLKPLRALGARVLGVDPARNVAKLAAEEGLETLTDFFGPKAARRILEDKGPSRLVTAANVFAHVHDLDSFLEGLRLLLAPDGVFIAEFPYLLDLLEKNLFDTIYHEHLSYFAVKPLGVLLARLGFQLFDVERVPTHGGSLRAFIQRRGAQRPVSSAVAGLLELEERAALDKLGTWRRFASRVASNKAGLVRLLKGLRAKGARVWGYGAPAKGNTLLNYFRVGSDSVEAIADDSPLKQGLYTPGTRIPVAAPDRLERAKPDYVLLLAWNFAGPIMEKLKGYREGGGRFILPVPEPRVL